MSYQSSSKKPSYRLHKSSGQAIVTLTDGLGGRRDVLLGRFDTKTSKLEYDRVIAEWDASGRQLPRPSAGPQPLNVNEVIVAYWKHCQGHYRKPDGTPTSELSLIKLAMRPLKALYGRTPAADFRPLAFKAVRQTWIDGKLSRETINGHGGRIRRMFAWATENELVPPSVFHGLQAVRGLQYGRSAARESKAVKPVPEAFVTAVLPHVSSPVAAMIQIQELTAARPGEVCVMRACDLDMTGRVWTYTPESHKTQHHGHNRQIYIGPKAQEVIRPFLTTSLEAFLFSPKTANKDRFRILRELRKTPVQPSQLHRRKRRPRKSPRDHYDVASYRRAIKYGCTTAKVPDWNPHRLRHNAATKLRKEFGVEMARIILGHSTAFTTEIYAEVDRVQAMEVIGKVG